ncbi:MAG: hypothetical protein WCK35_10045, partial [Chloroflexota bacterium]
MIRPSFFRIAFCVMIFLILGAGVIPAFASPANVDNQQGNKLSAPATSTPVYPLLIPGPISNSLKLERKISPEQFTAGELVNVALALRGENAQGCFGIPGKPIDAMLVFDISTSAGVGPLSNWEKTIG